MEGYQVITNDDAKLGRVVAVEGDHLIVEHGTLLKTRHAIPKTFAHVDDGEEVIRVSVSKDIVEASPKIENGSVDQRAVAQHYGLAEGFEEPETQGYGEMVADDPARSAAEDELRMGREPADAQRAKMREGGFRPEDEDLGTSPGLLGDR